jgi:hypothetical protein
MVQNLIVMVIVLVAIIFTCRRVYRILSKKNVKCGCAPEEDCSACSVPNGVKKGGLGSRSNGQKP